MLVLFLLSSRFRTIKNSPSVRHVTDLRGFIHGCTAMHIHRSTESLQHMLSPQDSFPSVDSRNKQWRGINTTGSGQRPPSVFQLLKRPVIIRYSCFSIIINFNRITKRFQSNQ
ncbi:hypothetical protein O6H91_Y325600 [Diphasiastrum complanatum]|nr:hypothetical protein O6H91_Y325600 [Diphasiastrum complanatum]